MLDLAEHLLRGAVARVDARVIAPRQAPVRPLDVAGRRRARDAEQGVEIHLLLLLHHFRIDDIVGLPVAAGRSRRPDGRPGAPAAPAAPADAYRFSPAFCCACISASSVRLIAFASFDSSAFFTSFVADSIAIRSAGVELLAGLLDELLRGIHGLVGASCASRSPRGAACPRPRALRRRASSARPRPC